MIEVNIDSSEVTRLAKLLEQAPSVIEAAKTEAIAAAAPKMKEIVDREIGGSGKVRGWQGQYIGSKGLYAAVRPKKKTWTEATKRKGNRYAVGYVTNAINSGHAGPRAKFAYRSVRGKFFYQHAASRLGQVAAEVSEKVSEALVSHVSGTSPVASPASPHAGEFQTFTRKIGGKTYTFRHV